MKLYNRIDFLELPSGVIFSKGKKYYFDGFLIKGDTININGKNIDFIYCDLVDIDSNDSGEWGDRLEEMLNDGVSYQINEDYRRDGCFDDEDIFLVYGKEDILKLMEVLKDAL